jgi:hypothetical protein
MLSLGKKVLVVQKKGEYSTPKVQIARFTEQLVECYQTTIITKGLRESSQNYLENT